MKQCPKCRQTYSDQNLNFCLEDGEMLTSYAQEPPPARYVDEPPATLLLDPTRVTNPSNWPSPEQSSPPANWQAQPLNAQQGQGQFAPYMMNMAPNQTLAITSLGLGIASVTIGWCCSLGVLLSPAALITGFLALSYIKKDPKGYGGRGLAIGGIVTGVIYLSVFVLILIIYGAAIIGGGLSSIR